MVGWMWLGVRVAWQVWWGVWAVMVTGWPLPRWFAVRVMVAVPAGVGVAAAWASTRPEVVSARVATCPGARPRKAALTVTVPCPGPVMAAGPLGLLWPRVWVMVIVGAVA